MLSNQPRPASSKPVAALVVLAALAALLIQLNPAWKDALIYQRGAIGSGQLWRLWTGHWVHFGLTHFMADTVFFLVVGLYAAKTHARFTWLALLTLPPFVSLVIYVFDPTMIRYAGLSALNLGLLLYLAGRGWQEEKRGWFWPAVVALYLADVVYGALKTSPGGGLIPFDDPAIKVATSAHLASALYALLAWGLANWGLYRRERR